MDYSKGFQFDEISVFTENSTKYCVPVWAYQTDLNIRVDTKGISADILSAFKEWSKTRKFPLFCSFDLPDGVYSAFLFKVCEAAENISGVDVSHYEYKGKNPSLAMKLPIEDCPFDEMLPVPKQETEPVNESISAFKAECAQVESLLEGSIKEAGMRKMNSNSLKDFQFKFPKYLYN
jgi:hypothetical protein